MRGINSLEPCSISHASSPIRSLYECLLQWYNQPFGSDVASETLALPPPSLGEVTSMSPREIGSRCGHPFAGCVLKSADCTRSGSKDQNKCIACRNGDRSRTWGTSLPDRRLPEAECRTASSGKRCASRAFAGGAGRRCRLSAQAFLPAFDACFHRYGPGSRVGGISDLT